MIRVGLLTTWNEKCGIAEYAANLVENCKDIDFKVSKDIIQLAEQSNVLCVNYEPGLFGYLTPEIIRSIRKPTVLILHTSHAGDNRNEFTNSFTKVVVHEKTQDRFNYIPMGIPANPFVKVNFNVPIPSVEPEYGVIGTCGIPFNKKGFHQIALAVELLRVKHNLCKARFIAPATTHYDTEIMKACVRGASPSCEYITEWMERDKVIETLMRNFVNAFAYNGNDSGISAAVRLGLAAKRPIVLTRDRQFRDLFDYEDEIEFVDKCTPDAIAQGITRVLENGKRPNRVLKDMSWTKVGAMYKNLFEEVLK